MLKMQGELSGTAAILHTFSGFCITGACSITQVGLLVQRMVPPRSTGSDKVQRTLQGETASAGSSAEKGHAASYQASQVGPMVDAQYLT